MKKFVIKKEFTGQSHRNNVADTFDTMELALTSLNRSRREIGENGGDIIEEDKTSFTFINNDNNNTEISYFIEEVEA